MSGTPTPEQSIAEMNRRLALRRKALEKIIEVAKKALENLDV